MITVEEALQLENVKRTEAEEKEFMNLQGVIDSSIYGYFNGGAFVVVAKTTAKIAAALKAVYERDGHWRVAVQPVEEGQQFKFVFSPF